MDHYIRYEAITMPNPFAFLSRFPHLHTVKLHKLFCHQKIIPRSPFLDLPSTIRHLEIEWCSEPARQTHVLGPHLLDLSFKRSFPQLQTLKLWLADIHREPRFISPDWIQTLPPSLTALSLFYLPSINAIWRYIFGGSASTAEWQSPSHSATFKLASIPAAYPFPSLIALELGHHELEAMPPLDFIPPSLQYLRWNICGAVKGPMNFDAGNWEYFTSSNESSSSSSPISSSSSSSSTNTSANASAAPSTASLRSIQLTSIDESFLTDIPLRMPYLTAISIWCDFDFSLLYIPATLTKLDLPVLCVGRMRNGFPASILHSASLEGFTTALSASTAKIGWLRLSQLMMDDFTKDFPNETVRVLSHVWRLECVGLDINFPLRIPMLRTLRVETGMQPKFGLVPFNLSLLPSNLTELSFPYHNLELGYIPCLPRSVKYLTIHPTNFQKIGTIHLKPEMHVAGADYSLITPESSILFGLPPRLLHLTLTPGISTLDSIFGLYLPRSLRFFRIASRDLTIQLPKQNISDAIMSVFGASSDTSEMAKVIQTFPPDCSCLATFTTPTLISEVKHPPEVVQSHCHWTHPCYH